MQRVYCGNRCESGSAGDAVFGIAVPVKEAVSRNGPEKRAAGSRVGRALARVRRRETVGLGSGVKRDERVERGDQR